MDIPIPTLSFQTLSIVVAGAGCLLGLRFILASGTVLKEWGLEETVASNVVSRRIGVVYLGLALMYFLGRAAAPSDVRSAVCLVSGGTIALLACLGLLDFVGRRAGVGIFRSVIAEALLAAGFLWVWWVGK